MKTSQHKKWTKLIVYTIAIALILLLAWLNIFSHFVLVIIDGHSMEPTYKHGYWFLANKNNTKLQHGDVIVFKIKNEKYIKRIVALPGDEIPVCYGIDDGQLYATIVPMQHVWLGLQHEWIIIPENYIWVEGDTFNNTNYNSDNNMSCGSGYIGLVSTKDIIGIMNYTEAPSTFWYTSVVNQKNTTPPEKFTHKHAWNQ